MGRHVKQVRCGGMRQNYSPDGATAAYLIVTCYNFELEDFFWHGFAREYIGGVRRLYILWFRVARVKLCQRQLGILVYSNVNNIVRSALQFLG